MDPAHRTLPASPCWRPKLLPPPNRSSSLMGNKPEERFNFITANAEFVEEAGLDI